MANTDKFTYTVTKEFNSFIMSSKEHNAICKLFHYIEDKGTDDQKMIMDAQLELYKNHAAYIFYNEKEFTFGKNLNNFYRLADSSDELIPLVADIMVAAVSNLKYKDGDYNDRSLRDIDFDLDEEFDTRVNDILNMLESKNDWDALNGYFKVYRYLFSKEDILMASFYKYTLERDRHNDMNINNALNFVYNQDVIFKKDEDEYEERIG